MTQTHSLDLELSSSQYASITNASQTGLGLTTDFSLEAWVKLEQLPSGAGTDFNLVEKAHGGADAGYRWFLPTTNKMHLNYWNASADTTDQSTAAILNASDVGAWVHLAVSVDLDGSIVMYKNGLSQAVTADGARTTTMTNGTNPFVIGATAAAAAFFDGLIKDVRVFSDIRTAGEIASDAHTENVTDANLQGEWNFNNAYTDSSGNGNTLTASGSPVFSTDIPWTAPSGVTGSDLETSLISYYEMEEASGTRVDATATGYDLTENGGTIANATGIQGNAADLEASSSQYFSKTNETALQFTGAFGISLWVKLESLPPDPSYYPIHKTDETNGWGLTASHTANTFSFAGYSGGANKFSISDPIAFTTATWYHLVMTGDGSTRVQMYVNGIMVADGAASGAIGAYTGAMNLGKHVTLARYYDGLLDEVGLWSRQLDYGDVLDLYNAGSGLAFIGSTAYTQDLEEVVTVADTKALQTGKILTEVATLVESQIRSTAKALTDILTLVASSATSYVFTRSFSDAITVTDTIAKQAGKAITEAITTADTIARTISRALTETVTAVASSASSYIYDRTFSDEITVTDNVIKTTTKALTETVTAVASLATRFSARLFTEVITVTATLSSIHGYFKTLTETVTLTATLTKVGAFARSLTESITLQARIRGLLNGLNMLYTNKYSAKAGSYFKKYLDPK